MHQIEYTNKPSITTLKAAIKKAVAKGETWIQLTWGENQITLENSGQSWYGSGWTGSGWIGRNGGYDLAQELNKMQRGKA
jgi:hypothetical protein